MSACQIEERTSYNLEYGTCTDANETERRGICSWDSHGSEAACVSQRMATDRFSAENNSDMSETERKRLYIRQSQQAACMTTQGTASTRWLPKTDLDTIECKSSNGRNVRFCLIKENEETVQDSRNVSERRCDNCDIAIKNNTSFRGQNNNMPHNFLINDVYDYADYTTINNGQEGIRRQNVCPVVNSSRTYCQNSFSERQCRMLLQRGQTTNYDGTLNEHSNDSGHGSGYVDVQGNFRDVSHQCVCTIEHSQWIKMCSSIKVLKRIVFALCVFNVILLIILIVVPVGAVIYFQANKDSSLTGTLKFQTSNEQHRTEPSCVKCQSLMHKFHNLTRTKNVIESMGDEDGPCCLLDTGKLMTIINQIFTEAVEIAKSSVCVSCRSEAIQREINLAVHFKSKENGLVPASKVIGTEIHIFPSNLPNEFIESTHFVGWETPVRDDHQGLWGNLDKDGTSAKVKSPGMYFIYVMIQHKSGTQHESGIIKISLTDNMTTATSGMQHAPLIVTLYKCQYGTNGESDVSPISQMYYSTGNTVQQNTYFGRIVHLTEQDKIYLGIFGFDFIEQKSDSHYMGLFKI